MKKIYFVPVGYVGTCLDLIEQGDKYALDNALFLEYEPYKTEPPFTACDNTDGDAWCEDFLNVETAIDWLLSN